jgi:hypothetical protein
LLNSTLREILQESKLQSIFIENVMSDKVREKFEINGWSIIDDSVYLEKQGGGKNKRSRTKKYRRKQIRKRRSYKQF